MVICVCTMELHLPACRSLKAKRMVLKRVKARVTNRFNVAIAEVGHQDSWQRSELAVVSVSSSRTVLESLMQKLIDQVEMNLDGVLLRYDIEYL